MSSDGKEMKRNLQTPKLPDSYGGHRWKDGVLAVLIVGVAVGCWWAYQQGRASKRQLHRMLKDMESLRRAEMALDDMQKELERARLEQENVATEKLNLEKKLQEAGNGNVSLTTSYSDLEVAQLKAEIDMLRSELQRAEGELEDRCWSPPAGLQMWLQLTHELENKAYLRKKQSADHQLQQAREACEKLKKKRSSLVGAFVSTHGKSIDDVDRSIVEARTALNEVTQELQERVYRWKQMELLCGFNIINNNGLQYLETALYRNSNGRTMRLKMSSSQDDLDLEDSSSLYSGTLSTAGAGLDTLGWKEDSSGSDELEQNEGILQGRHYPMDLKLAEARSQLEEKKMDEKKNQELRNQYLDRMLDYRNVNKLDSRLLNTAETQSPTQDSGYAGSQLDIKNSMQQSASNGKAKDAIQFTLGGDNWTGEDSALIKQTRPGTQSLRRPNSSQLAILPRPALPPRRVLPPPGAIVKSHSTEAGLDGLGEDLGSIPRPSNRAAGLIRQRTVASEVDTGSSSSEQSLTVTSNDKNINQISATDPLDPIVRRRKLRFPFPSKKVKVPTVNPS